MGIVGWKSLGQKPLRKRSVETLDFAAVLIPVRPMTINYADRVKTRLAGILARTRSR
jgi:hypothetical protein